MQWLDLMTAAINYIEDNLQEDISYSKAAQIAECSEYHFQRMFSYITSVTLAEYIRRRRLTLAAFELQNSNIKIIDLALKYRYESPISFARAFQKLHGINPTEARESGVLLKAYPRMSFQISIKGDVELNYRIVENQKYGIVGKYKIIKNALIEEEEPEMYKQMEDFYCSSSQELMDKFNSRKLYGVCMKNGKAIDSFLALMGVEAENCNETLGYNYINVFEGTFAVFQAVGTLPGSIEKTRKRIYTEWFPTSDYIYRENEIYEIQKYLEGDVNKENYVCEIWIPITRRNSNSDIE